MKLELIIDGKNVDLFDDEPINLTFAIADVQSIFTRDTTFSQNFKLPATPNNNDLFSHLFDITSDGTNFDSKLNIPCQLYKDSVLILDGSFQLLQIDKDDFNRTNVYNGTLTSFIFNFYSQIKDLTLRDLTFFQNYYLPNPTTPNQYVDYIESTWSSFLNNPDTDFVVYPIIDINKGWNYPDFVGYKPIFVTDLKPCISVKKIVDNIFSEAGYQYTSNFFNSDYFKRLIILNDGTLETTGEWELNFEMLFVGSFPNDFEYEIQIWKSSMFDEDRQFVGGQIYVFPANNDVNLYQSEFKTITGTGNFKPSDKIYIEIYVPSYGIRKYLYVANFSTFEVKFNKTDGTQEGFKIATSGLQYGDRAGSTTSNGGAGFTGANPLTWQVAFDNVIYDDGNFFDPQDSEVYANSPASSLEKIFTKDIKQSDFLVWLTNQFNLFIEWDSLNSRIVIEPRDDYYNASINGGANIIRDWTNILDITKSQSIKLLSDTQAKETIFSYSDDSDVLNSGYQEKFNERVYGDYILDLENEFATDQIEIRTGFAPTPLGNVNGSQEIIVPKIYGDEFGEEMTFKPRIFYYNGTQILENEFIYIANTSYPILSQNTNPIGSTFFAQITLPNNNDLGPFTTNGNVATTLLKTIEFDNDNLASPNFNTTNGRFTASNIGNYWFSAEIKIELEELVVPNDATRRVTFFLDINHYDASNNLINSYIVDSSTYTPTSPPQIYRTIYLNGSIQSLSMEIGEYVVVQAYYKIENSLNSNNYNFLFNVPTGYFESLRQTIQENNARKYNYYPYASELIGQTSAHTESIMYSVPQEIYFNYKGQVSYPDKGLYKKYWSNYLNEIQNNNSKLYTAYFSLTGDEISSIKFSDLVFIENTYYRINKINYNVISDDSVKVELLKLENVQTIINNNNVVVSYSKRGSGIVFNNVLGTKNNVNAYTQVIGDYNDALFSSRVSINGDANKILGYSNNIKIDGYGNIVDSSLSDVFILGNNNYTNVDKTLIIGGDNNFIGYSSTLPSGTTASTQTYTNVTLIGVSNYTGATTNSVVVPNLVVQSGLTVNNINFDSLDARDGSIFNSFNVTGGTIIRMKIDCENNFYFLISLTFDSYTIKKYNSHGIPDIDYNSNVGIISGSTNFINNAIIDIDSDKNLIVTGEFQNYSGNTRQNIIRLKSDGTEDTIFYNNIINSVEDFYQIEFFTQSKVLDDNKILFSTKMSPSYTGTNYNILFKTLSNGIKDKSFSLDYTFFPFLVEIRNFLITSNNDIIFIDSTLEFYKVDSNGVKIPTSLTIGEEEFYLRFIDNEDNFYTQDASQISRKYKPLGVDYQLVSSWNTNIDNVVSKYNTLNSTIYNYYLTSIQSDNKLLVFLGDFFYGTNKNILLRINSDGTEDLTFNPISINTNVNVLFNCERNGFIIESSNQLNIRYNYSTLPQKECCDKCCDKSNDYIVITNNFNSDKLDYNKTWIIDDWTTTASTITINLFNPKDGDEFNIKELRSNGGGADVYLSATTNDIFWSYPSTGTTSIFGGDNRSRTYKYIGYKNYWVVTNEYST